MMIRFKIILILVLGLWTVSTYAQTSNTCADVFETAVTVLNTTCGETGRNEACYGHQMLSAVPQVNVTSLNFDEVGDIEALRLMKSLRLSGWDADAESYGMALMRLQANLPDSPPDSNVTIILFGDSTIETATTTPQEINATVSASGAVNVRSTPSTSGTVVTALESGTTLIANGRNPAGDWIRVVLPDGDTAWIASFLLTLDGDSDTLDIVESTIVTGVFQAFYLQTGNGQRCAEVPNDGIVIQTPRGVGKIDFLINEVAIELGSTVYITAVAGDYMTVSVLEGEVTATTFDESQTAMGGARIRIPLDEDAVASGAPLDPEPIDDVLPELMDTAVNVLPNEIQIAVPLSEAQLAELEAQQEVCLLSSDATPNLRQGPGTVYAVDGQLSEETEATGQYDASDGFTWYQTASGAWVRADVVTTSGNCDDLPVVDDIPEPPVVVSAETTTSSTASTTTSSSSSSVGGVYYVNPLWHNGTCQYLGNEGSPNVIITVGTGGLMSEAEAWAWQSVETTTATINGQPAPAFIKGAPQADSPDTPNGAWWYQSNTPVITLASGEYTFVVSTNDPRNPQTLVCTYTVP